MKCLRTFSQDWRFLAQDFLEMIVEGSKQEESVTAQKNLELKSNWNCFRRGDVVVKALDVEQSRSY